MIREFEVSNYLSFGKKQRCSFRAPAGFGSKKGFVASLSRDSLSAYMVAVGPNASGKSNLLNALFFLLWFIRNSWNIDPDVGIPNLKHFRFDEVSNRKPTEFLLEAEDIQSGTRYRYELVIKNEKVIKEILFQKNINKQWTCIFGRKIKNSNKSNIEYTYELSKNIGITYDKNDFLPNASYVSILRRKKVPAIENFLQMTSHTCSLHMKIHPSDKRPCPKNITCEECLVREINESEELTAFINDFFTRIDSGINIQIKSEENSEYANEPLTKKKYEELKNIYEKYVNSYENMHDKTVRKSKEIPDGLKELKYILDELDTAINKTPETKTNIKLYAQHRVGPKNYLLDFSEESQGLQALIPILIEVHRLLKTGGVFIYDEIERSLHPLVLPVLVSLFSDSRKNKKHAQLLCTTHNVYFLKQLNKYHILLVEKNSEKQSNIWRLADMRGLRAEDNYVTRYLAGAYGAIPKTQSGD